MNKITVCGGGVLGSQIALQSAYTGKDVTIWVRNEDSEKRTQAKLDRLKVVYHQMLDKMNEAQTVENFCGGIIEDYDSMDYAACSKKIDEAYENVKIELNLKKAVKDADLVIESISEDLKLKKDFFKKVSSMVKKDAIIVTNSSSFLPSKFSSQVKRPDQFLALHFANNIYKQNLAEVMGTKETSKESFDAVVAFAESINMLPVKIMKEQEGYLLNTLVIPFMAGAMDLVVNGVSTVEDIDLAWRLGTNAAYGPFQIYDIVGLETGYNIVKKYVKLPSVIAPYNFKGQAALLKKYIDEGKTGVIAGEGFFKYDADGNRID